MHPTLDCIPYVVRYFQALSKAGHYIGNRVPFGMQAMGTIDDSDPELPLFNIYILAYIMKRSG